MIRLCFRFDDPSATSDHELERLILSAFARRGVPLTVAVVPFREINGETIRLREEHVCHLIEAQREGMVEVALHGLSHARRSVTVRGASSEFYGFSLSNQRQMIERGADHLAHVFDRHPTGFVPPWNTYDENTLLALAQAKYTYVSGGWDFPAESRAVATIPRTCWLGGLRTALAEAYRFRVLTPVVIAVLHHYDFKPSMKGPAAISLEALEELLSWTLDQPGVMVSTIANAAARGNSFAFGLRCHALRARLPWRLRPALPEHALLPHPLSWAASAVDFVVRQAANHRSARSEQS